MRRFFQRRTAATEPTARRTMTTAAATPPWVELDDEVPGKLMLQEGSARSCAVVQHIMALQLQLTLAQFGDGVAERDSVGEWVRLALVDGVTPGNGDAPPVLLDEPSLGGSEPPLPLSPLTVDGDGLDDGTIEGVAELMPTARTIASKRSFAPVKVARWTSQATTLVPSFNNALAVFNDVNVFAAASDTVLEARVDTRIVTAGMFNRPTSAPLM
jgi:hypothetical protein